MSMDTSQLPLPKPEPRARTKARKGRQAAAVIRRVREQCVERDGYCRLLGQGLGTCRGESQWAHLVSRAKTRGMAPELRHNTAITVMACQVHHDRIDNRAQPRLFVEMGEFGADGNLIWSCNGVQVRERR